jgi:ornithine cyclodeaminase
MQSQAEGNGIAWFDAEAIRSAITVEQAITAVEGALAADGFPATPDRMHVESVSGTLLTMPAAVDWGSGVKLVTVAPGNPARGLPLIHGVFVLFAAESMAPVAVMDGAALTALRTAAVSAVATRHLARTDAASLVMFGAGAQAHAHLHALRTVRDIASLAVVDPVRERAEQLAAHARELGIAARLTGPEAVATADIVCTCTTSREPLFDGALVPRGAYVNAVGSFEPAVRELDDATVARAEIVVETRRATIDETGDLLVPLQSGVITADRIVAELPDVIRRRGLPSGAAQDLVVFKSVGHAFEDLIVAEAVYRASAALANGALR